MIYNFLQCRVPDSVLFARLKDDGCLHCIPVGMNALSRTKTLVSEYCGVSPGKISARAIVGSGP